MHLDRIALRESKKICFKSLILCVVLAKAAPHLHLLFSANLADENVVIYKRNSGDFRKIGEVNNLSG